MMFHLNVGNDNDDVLSLRDLTDVSHGIIKIMFYWWFWYVLFQIYCSTRQPKLSK